MNDMHKLRVRVITPVAVEYTYEADMVVMPGAEGELGVLPRHIPMIVELKSGDLRIHNGPDIRSIQIPGGVARIEAFTVDVLHSGVPA
jgi:F-type H+-transporting ATPase subunit epsilon